jgi:predicted nucleotidyltransferase
MLTSEQIMDIIHVHRKEIQEFGVKRIGLFGSFRTDNQHRKSDVDILVEFKKGRKTFDNYMELKFFLEKSFGRPVDLVIKETIKHEMKPSILKSVAYATGF